MNPKSKPVRVAIIGGGCAGMAAAWELAKAGGHEVHVYEASWRLGGKGGSSRTAQGRIAEHGLHVWGGFYENAFRMMRECYAEVAAHGWGPRAPEGSRLPHGTIDEAFAPLPLIGLAVPNSAGGTKPGAGPEWGIWTGILPAAEGLPGTPLDADSNPFTVTNYTLRCAELVRAMMHSMIAEGGLHGLGALRPVDQDSVERAHVASFADDAASLDLAEWAAGLLRSGGLTLAAILSRTAGMLQTAIESAFDFPGVPRGALTTLIAVLSQTRKLLAEVADLDPAMRRRLDIIDLVVAVAIGMWRDRLLLSERGFDAINGEEYTEWLRRHGASEAALTSPFVTGFYNYAFAFVGGDRSRPRIAAGVALRGALRMFFSYRGALFWRMGSGMGEAVFSPLYKTLAARGVKFHFRHRLDAAPLEWRGDTPLIARLEFRTDGDPDTLDAIAADALDHFGCWPEEPGPFAAAGTQEGRRTLAVGDDFDAVILATDKEGACQVAARSGILADPVLGPRWTALRDKVKTGATMAAQVWLTKKQLAEAGWGRDPIIMTALPAAFTTVADMSHTIASEAEWRAAAPKPVPEPGDEAVLYLCGEMADADLDKPGAAPPLAQVRKHLEATLQGGLAPHLLRLAPDSIAAGALAADAHLQANTEGAGRYSLSLPGTIDARISPLEDGIANFTVAGDWTANGIDAGCVEAAVMSGMLAAHAITGGTPALDTIIGYDHP